MNFKKLQKGFTLIELLVVIGILAILVVGLMVAIDPQDKLRSARDTRTINDFGAVARALEAYTTTSANSSYPQFIADLAPNELKTIPPTTGWSVVNYINNPPTAGACTTAAGNCTGIGFAKLLESRKYVGQTGCTSTTTWYRYYSPSGSACATCAANATASLTSACLPIQ